MMTVISREEYLSNTLIFKIKKKKPKKFLPIVLLYFCSVTTITLELHFNYTSIFEFNDLYFSQKKPNSEVKLISTSTVL